MLKMWLGVGILCWLALPVVGGTDPSIALPIMSSRFSSQGEKRVATSEPTCFSDYNEAAMMHLEGCCWYNSYSCCTPETAGFIIPHVKTGISKTCYATIASILCLSCSPNTNSFVKQTSSGVQVRVCGTFCATMWNACKPDVLAGLISNVPVTSAQEFCAAMFKADPRIIVVPTSCFQGVEPSVIENSGCLPPLKTASATTTEGNQHNEGDGAVNNTDLLHVLIGLTGTIVALLSCVIIGLVLATAYVMWKRWRESEPWNIEPEEEEDEIQMEEIRRAAMNAPSSFSSSNSSAKLPSPASSTSSSRLPSTLSPQSSSTSLPKPKPVTLYRSDSKGIPAFVITKDKEKDQGL